jgi:hypothetical protein
VLPSRYPSTIFLAPESLVKEPQKQPERPGGSYCSQSCRVIRLRPISWLPKISMGITLDALARRLRCAECGGPLQSVKPWRQTDASGKAWG